MNRSEPSTDDIQSIESMIADASQWVVASDALRRRTLDAVVHRQRRRRRNTVVMSTVLATSLAIAVVQMTPAIIPSIGQPAWFQSSSEIQHEAIQSVDGGSEDRCWALYEAVARRRGGVSR